MVSVGISSFGRTKLQALIFIDRLWR